jgi:DNA-directed RNA polymerase
MRCGEDTFQHNTLLAHASTSLQGVFDAMDYLATCPWNINEKVRDCVCVCVCVCVHACVY